MPVLETDLDVVSSPSRAATLLHPLRLELLRRLRDPDSAAGLARAVGVPRQTLNYHLRELEQAGFVELVEERRKGNMMERVVRASARSYLIDPGALGEVGLAEGVSADRFSAAYLLATAAQVIRDLAMLRRRAAAAGKQLATFTLSTEVSFPSAAARRAFTEELAGAVASLVAKHTDDTAPQRRRFTVVVGAYPTPQPDPQPAPQPEE